MTIDDAEIVDIIYTEETHVVLVISDHLSWQEQKAHFDKLEAKINYYIDVIDSGELPRAYPPAQGRKARIEVLLKHDPPPEFWTTLEKAQAALRINGIGLSARVKSKSAGSDL